MKLNQQHKIQNYKHKHKIKNLYKNKKLQKSNNKNLIQTKIN